MSASEAWAVDQDHFLSSEVGVLRFADSTAERCHSQDDKCQGPSHVLLGR